MRPLNYAKHKNKFPGDVRNHNFPNNEAERLEDSFLVQGASTLNICSVVGVRSAVLWCPADKKMEFN